MMRWNPFQPQRQNANQSWWGGLISYYTSVQERERRSKRTIWRKVLLALGSDGVRGVKKRRVLLGLMILSAFVCTCTYICISHNLHVYCHLCG